ncbi:MAG: ATP-binding cassette domain-containing protein, partial [Elusimicrobiota bacterium]
MITIEHLSYKYPDGTIGLNDINLTVRNGEVVTLIGANGTGKSTLLLALMGIIEFSG